MKAVSTSCDLGVRLNTRKNSFTKGLEQVTRQAVAFPSLEIVKIPADRAMVHSIQCRLQPCFEAEVKSETSRDPFPPTFQQVCEIQLQGVQ